MVPAQVLTGGVSNLQIVGSLSALLTSICTPVFVGSPSKWHKQIGLLSNSPASDGQHSLSGLVKLLPCSTNVKQLDMFINTVIQSISPDVAGPDAAAGDIAIDGGSAAAIGGIVCASTDGVSIVENREIRIRMRNVVVEAILIVYVVIEILCVQWHKFKDVVIA